ncbi:signal peptidase II, partial [candidate division WOR-3 bacterium]|nr:signal peptidase II [candidate division WOR-3 bacterium]
MKKVYERLYFIIFLFISIISVDQLTKYLIRKTFIIGESKEILGSFFRFTFVLNPYAAFGLSLGPRWIYYLFVFLAIALIVYYFIKNYSKANEFE